MITTTRRLRVRTRALAGVTALLLLGTAACGSSSDSSSPTTTAGGSPTTTAPVAAGGAGGAAGGSFEGTADLVLDGFTPEVNGFSFENYGNETAPSNLTAGEMKKFFGDQVCASDAGGTCTLTPPAQQWMDQTNDAMNGGHCEGMAVLALMLIKGQIDIKQFGDASTANGLKLEGNEALAREIAYWWATQSTSPANTDRLMNLKPSEVVAKLKESFQPGAPEAYTFAFFRRDGTGGHAITPFGVKDKGNGVVDVAVYDNNYPNQTKSFVIDTANETWSYNTTTKPSEPAAAYEGDATSQSLWLAPISARQKPQTCPFCEGQTSGATGLRSTAAVGAFAGDNGSGFNELTLNYAAGHAGVDITITDLDGQPITGATEQTRFAGDGIPPVQMIPAGQSFKVKLDATKITEAVSTDLTFIGPGTDQFIDGINLDPGQVDTIEFKPTEGSVTYETTSNESPTMGSGFTDPGADFAVGVGGVDLPEGGKVEMKLDEAAGTVTITNQGKAPGAYAVAIARMDDAGVEQFSSDGIELVVGGALVLDYGVWNNGEQLQASVVEGGTTTPLAITDSE